MSLASTRAEARRGLHEAMQVSAFYYASGEAEPVACFVRYHHAYTQHGDQKGTNLNSAVMEDQKPRMRFWIEDMAALGIDPTTGSIVTLADQVTKVRLGAKTPPHFETVDFAVAELSARDAAKYAFPPPEV